MKDWLDKLREEVFAKCPPPPKGGLDSYQIANRYDVGINQALKIMKRIAATGKARIVKVTQRRGRSYAKVSFLVPK
jgi:transposase